MRIRRGFRRVTQSEIEGRIDLDGTDIDRSVYEKTYLHRFKRTTLSFGIKSP